MSVFLDQLREHAATGIPTKTLEVEVFQTSGPFHTSRSDCAEAASKIALRANVNPEHYSDGFRQVSDILENPDAYCEICLKSFPVLIKTEEDGYMTEGELGHWGYVGENISFAKERLNRTLDSVEKLLGILTPLERARRHYHRRPVMKSWADPLLMELKESPGIQGFAQGPLQKELQREFLLWALPLPEALVGMKEAEGSYGSWVETLSQELSENTSWVVSAGSLNRGPRLDVSYDPLLVAFKILYQPDDGIFQAPAALLPWVRSLKGFKTAEVERPLNAQELDTLKALYKPPTRAGYKREKDIYENFENAVHAAMNL